MHWSTRPYATAAMSNQYCTKQPISVPASGMHITYNQGSMKNCHQYTMANDDIANYQKHPAEQLSPYPASAYSDDNQVKTENLCFLGLILHCHTFYIKIKK